MISDRLYRKQYTTYIKSSKSAKGEINSVKANRSTQVSFDKWRGKTCGKIKTAIKITVCRKSMFFQIKCLFLIPIPFRTLCWLCFVQSLVCPYFGILAENPFPWERGYITGATAPRPCRGLRPCDPIFINQEVYRQSEK